MSDNLIKLWTTQFSTNLELKLQQRGSKLRGKVIEGAHVGKLASPINQSPVYPPGPGNCRSLLRCNLQQPDIPERN